MHSDRVPSANHTIPIMNTIGDYTVLESLTFLIPANQDVWATVSYKQAPLKIKVTHDVQATEQSLRVLGNNTYAEIAFAKWDNPFGTATTAPIHLATAADGKKLFFMAAIYKIGTENATATYRLDIEFLLEGAARD